MSPIRPDNPDEWYSHNEKFYRGPARQELQNAICAIVGGSDCPEIGSGWEVWNDWWAVKRQ